MKALSYLLLITTLLSCSTSYNSKMNFGYEGALRNMMHEGDLSAKANLNDFENMEHLYALGALENLKGEIQIFDSEVYNSRVSEYELVFETHFDSNACLFVHAQVEKWVSVNLPADIATMSELERFIEKAAKKHHLDTDAPFPFLIRGKVKQFDWHVINWKDGDTEHTHEKHVHSGLFGSVEHREVELLGFYSKSHQTVFTHHTSFMHIHVKTVDGEIAGHVDDLILGREMTLLLPA